jgi:hypothetical protein
VAHGHSAHVVAADADQHEHSNSEHGCVGHQHVCPCCASMPMAQPPAVAIKLAFRADCRLIEPSEQRAGPSGVSGSLFRPPIA